MGNNEPYNDFLSALRKKIDDQGYGSKYWLAIETGLSTGFISQILNKKKPKKAGREAQYKIAAAYNCKLDEFMKMGRDSPDENIQFEIKECTQSYEVKNKKEKHSPLKDPPSIIGNILSFPCNHRQDDDQLKTCIGMLVDIFEHGDQGTIAAIDANLRTFKKLCDIQKEAIEIKNEAIEAKKDRAEMKERQGSLEEELESLKRIVNSRSP